MCRRFAVYSLLLLGSTSFANGLEFSVEYTADILRVVSGGLSTGTEYLDNLDVALEIDVAEAWGAGAGTILVHGLYNNRSAFSADRVGDLQVVSNIDADEAWRLFQLWYELAEANWSIRAGLYDLNSEFDVNETGSIFLNSSRHWRRDCPDRRKRAGYLPGVIPCVEGSDDDRSADRARGGT